LDALSNVSDYTGLFDQYRIKSVEIWYMPQTTEVLDSSTGAGLFATCIDYDDATALGSFDSVLEYESAQVASGITGQYQKYQPRAALDVYSGAASYNALTEADQWFNLGDTSIRFYGSKYAWTGTGTVYVMEIVVRLTIQLRAVR
jgi:hypothetical protein